MKKQLLRTLTASILLMSTSVLAQEARRERNVSRQPNLAAVSTSPVS